MTYIKPNNGDTMYTQAEVEQSRQLTTKQYDAKEWDNAWDYCIYPQDAYKNAEWSQRAAKARAEYLAEKGKNDIAKQQKDIEITVIKEIVAHRDKQQALYKSRKYQKHQFEDDKKLLLFS